MLKSLAARSTSKLGPKSFGVSCLSLHKGERESEGLVCARRTPPLYPLPFAKGRGEKSSAKSTLSRTANLAASLFYQHGIDKIENNGFTRADKQWTQGRT